MPLHDWAGVPPGDYLDFRGAWLIGIKVALNDGLLPPDYFALVVPTIPPGGNTVGRWRVEIQRARDRHLIAVIELVSPGNKASKSAFADLVRKSVQLLRQGVHVVLIDPFPPTARDPKGIHAVVWNELTGKPFTPPSGKPLTLASYAALGGNTFTAHVDPLAVGDRLPDVRLFLTDEYFVPTPLEATYAAAWKGFPAMLRAVVER